MRSAESLGSVAVLWLALVGCAVPYDPEPVRHPVPLPADAFERVLGVFRDRSWRVAEAVREPFRIQSEWLPFQHGEAPGFRRASVFTGDAGQLQVVVEMYFLELGARGPQATGIVGDRRAEQELAAVLEQTLRR